MQNFFTHPDFLASQSFPIPPARQKQRKKCHELGMRLVAEVPEVLGFLSNFVKCPLTTTHALGHSETSPPQPRGWLNSGLSSGYFAGADPASYFKAGPPAGGMGGWELKCFGTPKLSPNSGSPVGAPRDPLDPGPWTYPWTLHLGGGQASVSQCIFPRQQPPAG